MRFIAILAHLPILFSVLMGLVADTCTQGSNVVGTIVIISLPLWLCVTVFATLMLIEDFPWRSVSLGRGILQGLVALPVIGFAFYLLPLGFNAAALTLTGVNPCGRGFTSEPSTAIESAGAVASVVICVGSIVSVLLLALIRKKGPA